MLAMIIGGFILSLAAMLIVPVVLGLWDAKRSGLRRALRISLLSLGLTDVSSNGSKKPLNVKAGTNDSKDEPAHSISTAHGS